MAKNKSFDFGSLMPNAEAAVSKAAAPAPAFEKKIEIKMDPPEPAAPVMDQQTFAGSTASDSLSMQPKKKKNKKMVSFNLNEDNYIEFTRINKSLGYKNTEVIADLIEKYIKANQGK